MEQIQKIIEKSQYRSENAQNKQFESTLNTTTVKPHNIRVNPQLAEYAYEEIMEKEMKVSEEEYQEFKRKYHRMVFDKKGNYLYTKLEPQTEDQQRSIKEIYQQKNTSQKFQKDLINHQKNFQPEKIIQNLVKSSQEQASMNPRKKAILDIKEKSLKGIQQMLNLGVKQKIIENAQQEVIKASQEMISEVEKLIRENEILKGDLEKSKDLIVELQTQNENQNWKNSCLKKDIEQINVNFDILKNNSSQLEVFIPEYKKLMLKFPGMNSNTLIHKFEKLENFCLELNKKSQELEIQKRELEQEKQKIKNLFDSDVQELKIKETTRKKQTEMYLEKLKEKEIELKDSDEYKKNYIQLQNRIINIYNKWNSKIKVYSTSRKDNEPIAHIKDPLEILDYMEKNIQISTSDRLQEYLRKIIVSANLLQRKYLPLFVNEKFDPDKIYERILKLVNNLNAENFKLKAQIDQFKKKEQNTHDLNYHTNKKNTNEQNSTNSFPRKLSLTKTYQFDD
ncbi:hypothetical protein IMG5_168530 [Ichthyophthirius multifiliis]|uniref:Uncharacterized protein n=1 Tax=Ichthyophthirius multifiliis TaxID=5932 RepID=G0R150_ICHMU|nr:hypothetical protein IMG5_168530 [Ichthyophthirius multifiliis]EGR28817.1 hypothetical protein IMG5_168530 [Ichthyophthirius multifiliis]|eukprot:XP_004030053.1 hypothetical protein IMG5_168530 [Ichthyophthirius multifiliis]